MRGGRLRSSSLILGILLVLLAGCGSGEDSGESESAAVTAEGGDAAVVDDGDAVDIVEQDAGGGEEAGGGDGADDAVGGGVEPLPPAPEAAPGDRVIKEGTVTVEVDAGGFDRAYAAVVAAARRLGGDVVGSDTSTGDDGLTSGSVTVRVPVRAYEDLVVGVGEVGTVRGRSLSAEDVSAEYVDLESRLRHLEAQEAFYLGLMEDAADVEDAIAVQQRLDAVQGDVEQVEGRLRYLADRTSFSTLTVELAETGAAPLATEPGARPTLARYWDTARDAFVNVLGVLLVVAVFAAPLLLVALVGVAVVRALGARRAGPPAATPAEPPADRDADREADRDDEPVGAPPA